MEHRRFEKVSTRDLEIGMYVDHLDRPWTDTPFLFQGFHIHDQEEVEELRRHCAFVFIDRAHPPEAGPEIRPASRSAQSSIGAAPVRPAARPARENALPVERELGAARVFYEEARQSTRTLISGLIQSGQLDIKLARQTVEPMVDSMLRNPDALVWLSRMKTHDAYLFSHSLNACIWGIAFARHLGAEREVIFEVGLGCLLLDVGKSQIPVTLLLKPGEPTEEEWTWLRAHVAEGLVILKGKEGITARILDLVRAHHERHDGSGYPQGLKGEAIPMPARIAGIVDSYDALTSFRPYAGQRSPDEALKTLSALRGTLFHPDTVDPFLQLVGVFPTGSLVELNTGAVGVVVAQNHRRLRPRVALLLDEKKHRLAGVQLVDMLYDHPWSDAGRFWIDHCLQSGAYGLDPQAVAL